MESNLKSLLFSVSQVTPSWFQRFEKEWREAGLSLSALTREIREYYAAHSQAVDGFSRLACVLMSRRDYEDALRLFDQDVVEERQSWWQQLRHAECIAMSGQLETAYSMVNRVYDIHPKAVNGFAAIGWALRTQPDRLSSPWACARRDWVLGRLSAGYMLNVAELAAMENCMEDARLLVEKAYQVEPVLTDGHARFAWARYWPKRETGELVRWMECDRIIDKLSPAWLLNLSFVRATDGRIEDAIHLVEQAYAGDAKLHDGYTQLARIHCLPLRDYRNMLSLCLRDDMHHRLSPKGRLVLAHAHALNGDIEQALSCVADAYRQNGSLQDGYAQIASAFYIPRKEYPNALALYRKDADQQRLADSNRFILANLQMRLGQDLEAADNFLAIKSAPLRKWTAAFQVWSQSLLWPLSPNPAADRLASVLLRRILEHTECNPEVTGLLHGAVTDMAVMRERLAVKSEQMGLDLRAQMREIVLRKNGEGAHTEPLSFLNARLHYVTASDLFVLFNEIVLSESDRFEAERDDPFIIDGGANIGTSIAYFKWLYPKSRIVAFEPNPAIFAVCKRNVELNGWKNVTLLPYALAGTNGELDFHCDLDLPMASTLLNRPAEEGRHFASHKVQAKKINEFIDCAVDFLKLDIEGSECQALLALGDLLDSIQCGIIEYHYGSPQNSLSMILHMLEEATRPYFIKEPFSIRHITGLRQLTPRWSRSIFFTRPVVTHKMRHAP